MSEHVHDWRANGYTMPEYECACGVSERDATQQRIAALEAENARMRAVVEAVAGRADSDAGNVSALRRCRECGCVGHAPLEHKRGCLAEQARAILASASDNGTTNEPPA